VAEDGTEGGEGFSVAWFDTGVEQGGQAGAEPDRAAAFEHVKQEGGCAQSFAAGAQYVGGADVAAAYGTDVLLAEDAHQQVPGGDGPQQE